MPDVLVCDFACFQVNQDKAFKNIIVKDQINIVIFFFRVDMLLTRYERIAFTKLHQEFLKIRENTCFKFSFREFRIGGKAQILSNDWIFDKL